MAIPCLPTGRHLAVKNKLFTDETKRNHEYSMMKLACLQGLQARVLRHAGCIRQLKIKFYTYEMSH
jgi:hypothetical protein